MRKIIVGILVLLILLVATLLVAPGFVDWNRYKPEIAARVKQASGRDLAIAGDIGLTLLPAPAFSVEGVRLSNFPGGTAAEMVALKALDVRIALLPLLQGDVKVESVSLVEPVVELEVLADGRANWSFGDAPAVAGVPAEATPAGSGSLPMAIRLDNLKVRGGTIVYRDSRAGRVERVEKLNADIAAGSLSGPFRIHGELVARGVPVAIDASIGELVDAGDVRADLGLTLTKTGDRLSFNGGIKTPLDKARLAGKLKAEGRDLATLVAAIAEVAPATGPLAQPFSLTGAVQADAAGAALNDLELQLGETRATGGINATFVPEIRVDAALALGRLDLDRLLAPPPATGPTPPASETRAAATTPTDTAATAPAFSLPGDVAASLDLTADSIVYNGDLIREGKLNVRLTKGQIVLDQAAVSLPGNGKVNLAGSLESAKGAPRFTGKLNFTADNLRGLLTWLAVELPPMPADRLRTFALTGDVAASPGQVDLTGADLRFDNSRVTGGIVFALRTRPAFGVRLAVDQLNLDAYLPSSPGSSAKPAETNAPKRLAPKPAPEKKIEGKAPSPLAFLDAFDANLIADINRLTYRQTPAYDLHLDAGLQAGTLTLRDFRIGNLAGTGGKVTGAVGNLATTPTGKLDFSFAVKDLPRLLLLADMPARPGLSNLGTLSVDGYFEGREQDSQIDMRLAATGVDARLAGLIQGLPLAPHYELSLDAGHRSLAGLMQLFDPDRRPSGRDPGPVRLRGSAKGDFEKSAFDLTAAVAGGEVRVAGNAAALTTAPSYQVSIESRHPEFGQLVRAFVPGYRPPSAKLGAFALSAKLAGNSDAATISDFRSNAGPVILSGVAQAKWSGPRPSVAAQLASNAIDLNAFLPTDSGASAAPAGKNGGSRTAPAPAQPRWSREPLDLAALRAVDANITLSAPSLIYTKYRVDNPQLDLSLSDGILTLKRLAGAMFDGPFAMTGQLSATDVPSAAAAVAVQRANIRKALFTAGNIDVADGIMDMTLNLTTRGRSEAELVSGLGGDARLSVTKGVVEGFDLKAVSDQLKNLHGAVSILALLQKGMSGGSTRFSSLDGTFRIAKGIATTNDLRLVAEAGEGRGAGTIDLPRWQIALGSEFRLTEHPNAPPFGMRIEGSLDDPRRVFEIEKLQAFLLQRGIGGLLKKVLPQEVRPTPSGSTVPQQQPPTQQPAQQQAPRPEDALRGILDIFKKR